MKPIFDWSFALEILPTLGSALLITIQATVLGMLVAVTLGLALALLRRSRLAVLSLPTAFVIEFVRSTPLLVQMYFLFYVLPLTGVQMSPLATGIVALGLHYATYCAEVYRAGIEAVPRGQLEAARALNMSPWRTAVGVVLPQAIPPVVPALGNYLVAMFKDTPLLSAITVVELLQQSKMIGSTTFRYTEPLTLVGVLFLALSLIAAWGVRGLEARLQRYGGKR
ncbi:ectoine/hydroxyectoine ABC transporter permease subunit EhuD [Achromobacter xylosoxidans]|jgi:polar amino acid transport system permease protein|uniref:Ectoine/hydroxyectoine ABC transporter permease subunit EhuD n=1 Tax=Alcaligenes xylosoxydans xylosoxydans TaxID=85698 RepID=A0A0D6I2T8_ALCXX|nr:MULTISPECIES: ectoine/hydroxyectoine ABC transporter permease subunit EhuD [Achromobacter]AHC48323.1 putative inner membrane component of binding-protein-dependent transport system [Achromobacter xylosoxidans NBRC 15126 = ATCC 27061]AMH04346.1 ectoine/hydroxyectoine ABC transporter permease subunit EhuD [Achromobacter xylosoxidans]KAA5925751.1 ectoine/hydroxyectoine ABC transporter permease subunit EhuD [Achromobacter xylosoxidans]KWU22303.1 ectoine/hydroxyectoine ABC transporter permease su